MVYEIFIVLILTLLNGFFSMSEIALVTIRKTRVGALVKQGNKRAKVVQYLQKNPEDLFATIQIGISVITIAASAFAGASLAADLEMILEKSNFNFIVSNSSTISFGLVVALVSYVNITIGELIPKSIGLRYAESVALLAAYPVWGLSKLSRGLIKILNVSSNLFLKLFKDSTTFMESRLSEEEIRTLISEGTKAGTIEPMEHSLIENVFNMSDTSVDKIMVPRASITALNIADSGELIVQKAVESGYSRIPIYQGDLNNTIGILYTKKLLPELRKENPDISLKEFLVPPYFVPSTMKTSEVLKRMQRKKAHVALVTNEHGEVEGLVALEDVLEEIVGDIDDEIDETDVKIKEDSMGFTVLGNTSIVDFNKYFQADLPEHENFNTVAGFILEKLERFPKPGDVVEFGKIKFTVKEATSRTITSTVIEKL
ncbi:MAG: hemolysin family protein [Candidatus Paceibacterota bacterium]|jgi:putative hemolysin